MKEYLLTGWKALVTVFIGMKITFKHLFTPAVTIQYPDVKPVLPERERNRLYVNMDDCIGCDQCARACPVSCIEIETVKGLPGEDLGKTSNGKKKALWVTTFNIDIAKCCYCQLCVFPCPTECIYMTDVYEFSEFERSNLVYDFVTLTPTEREEKKVNYAKLEAEKAALKAAAPAAAPKPAAPKPPVVKPEAANETAVKAEPVTKVEPVIKADAAPKMEPTAKVETLPVTDTAPKVETAPVPEVKQEENKEVKNEQ